MTPEPNVIPFHPRDPVPAIHAKWAELRRAYGPPRRASTDNPHPYGSTEWRAWQQGAETTNRKWLDALYRLPNWSAD